MKLTIDVPESIYKAIKESDTLYNKEQIFNLYHTLIQAVFNCEELIESEYDGKCERMTNKEQTISNLKKLKSFHNGSYGADIDNAIGALEQESCEDAISRQAAIDAVKKNTFRLTFAKEQDCEGHVAWSAEAVYSDVIEGALLELSPVTPQPKKGSEDMSEVEVEIIKTEETKESEIKYLNINASNSEVERNPDIVRLCADAGVLEYVKPKTGRWIDDKCSVCGKGIDDLIDSCEWYKLEEPKFCPFCGVKIVESEDQE